MQRTDKDSIMEFLCRFLIKVIGIAENGLEMLVTGIVGKHVPDLTEGAVRNRLSREGKYISITITVTVESRQQLDNIYLDVTTHEKVLMAL